MPVSPNADAIMQAQKRTTMKRTGARAADRKRSKDTEHQDAPPEQLKVSFDQVEDRAFTKTEVLAEILEGSEAHYQRHWGLNE